MATYRCNSCGATYDLDATAEAIRSQYGYSADAKISVAASLKCGNCGSTDISEVTSDYRAQTPRSLRKVARAGAPAKPRVTSGRPAPWEQAPARVARPQPGALRAQRSPYAGFWRRFVALWIDQIILVFFTLAVMAFSGIAMSHLPPNATSRALIGWAMIVLLVASVSMYFALLESSAKQATLGKMALGVVVTDLNGKRISFARALARTFAKIVSGLPLNIGYLIAGFTEKKQALHDKMASTLVMRREAATVPAVQGVATQTVSHAPAVAAQPFPSAQTPPAAPPGTKSAATLHKIGILFDIDALGSGSYGHAAYQILFEAIDTRQLAGCLLRDGDTRTTLAGRANQYCIAVESIDPSKIAAVKNALSNSEAKGLLPLASRFIETAQLAGEPLVVAAGINAAGDLQGDRSGWVTAAWKESRGKHAGPVPEPVVSAAAPQPSPFAQTPPATPQAAESRFTLHKIAKNDSNGDVRQAAVDAVVKNLADQAFLASQMGSSQTTSPFIQVETLIERPLDRVWEHFLATDEWEAWWGGGVKAADWREGGKVTWARGPESRITVFVPKQLVRIAGTWMDEIFMFAAAGKEKTVLRLGESAPRHGAFFTDGGASRTLECRKCLARLKRMVEEKTHP
ncbi:MAG TPA: RDD family protein [Methylomirabilota bacterium]|nr:RDD family protein [Methylomirabilota bacterium]